MVKRLLRAGVIALIVLTEAAHAQTSADLDIPVPAAPTRTAASDAAMRATCMRIGARIQEAAVADDETDDRVLGKRQEEVAGAAIQELAAFARAHSGAVAAADAKLLLCFLAGGTTATREHALRWRAELGRELRGSWRALAVAMLEAEDVLSGRARPELGPADRRRIAIELGRANLATAAQVEPPEEADQEVLALIGVHAALPAFAAFRLAAIECSAAHPLPGTAQYDLALLATSRERLHGLRRDHAQAHDLVRMATALIETIDRITRSERPR